MNTHIKGKIGENFAAEYLIKNGYEIIRRNYYCKGGEIDIIAQDEKYMLFVEVKSFVGENEKFGRPINNVTKAKQSHMLVAAQSYILENKPQKQPRIDVIEIYLKFENGTFSLAKPVLHIKNAVSQR